MIVDIQSANPNFSYCLNKNPETAKTQPFSRPVRKGRVYGWFPADDTFRMWFKDNPVESSFASGNRESFEYLDVTRYTSPQAFLAMATEMMGSLIKKSEEQDVEGFTATVTTTLWGSKNSLEWMKKALGDALSFTSLLPPEISERLVHHGLFRVQVTGPTVHKAFDRMMALVTFQTFNDPNCDLRMKEEVLLKYAKILVRAEMPYHPRALFLSKFTSSPDTFAKVAKVFEEDGNLYAFGNSQVQRASAIKKVFQGGDTLVDIGCGEGFHLLKMSGDYANVVGIDRNNSFGIEQKAAKRRLKNVTFIEQDVTPEYLAESSAMFEGADVLFSEVIEHNPFDLAAPLLNALLATPARRIVVTVPDRDFNVNFGMAEGEFRHYDHKWEPTWDEWTALVDSLNLADWKVEYYGIGNKVGNSSLSIMTVFRRIPVLNTSIETAQGEAA